MVTPQSTMSMDDTVIEQFRVYVERNDLGATLVQGCREETTYEEAIILMAAQTPGIHHVYTSVVLPLKENGWQPLKMNVVADYKDF